MATLSIDVLIATCDRAALLARTLESIRTARRPPDLAVRIVVLDNGTRDFAGDVTREAACRTDDPIEYLRLPPKGKSYALNAGIRSTTGNLIGVVDDDEEIEGGWFETVARTFAWPEVDFAGGPMLPRWMAPPPPWMPCNYRGVIGHVDDGDRVMVFGEDAPGILVGGNAVMRRSVLERVGLFSTRLGPTPRWRLLPGEDEELFRRLLDAGARGLYLPDLRIRHVVPAYRLEKRYWRRWCFWRGVARSIIERWHPTTVAHVGAVPRYLVGRAVRAGMRLLLPARPAAARFTDELAVWDLIGFLWGVLRWPVAPAAERLGGAGADRNVAVEALVE